MLNIYICYIYVIHMLKIQESILICTERKFCIFSKNFSYSIYISLFLIYKI